MPAAIPTEGQTATCRYCLGAITWNFDPSEVECEGHESLRGDLMGAVDYCDGTCNPPSAEYGTWTKDSTGFEACAGPADAADPDAYDVHEPIAVEPHHPIGASVGLDGDRTLDGMIVYRTPEGREVVLVLADSTDPGFRPIIREVGSTEVRIGYMNDDGTEPEFTDADFDWIDRAHLTPARHLDHPGEVYDTASPASRQHYIDTGAYLFDSEAGA